MSDRQSRAQNGCCWYIRSEGCGWEVCALGRSWTGTLWWREYAKRKRQQVMASGTLQNEETLPISSSASFLETYSHTSLTFRKAPNVRKERQIQTCATCKPFPLPTENTRIWVLFSRIPPNLKGARTGRWPWYCRREGRCEEVPHTFNNFTKVHSAFHPLQWFF